jgi:hypothetical protein
MLNFLPSQNVRLALPGDFNAEIYPSALQVGANEVTLTATLTDNSVIEETINIFYQPTDAPPESVAIDWSNVTEISEVAQAVDGKWVLESAGVRIVEPHYDRLLAIGDISWQDYEVTTTITVNQAGPPAAGFWPAVGVLMRWDGHDDWGGNQPTVGWHPLGAIGWMRWDSGGNSRDLQIWEDNGTRSSSVPRVWQVGIPYNVRMKVETVSGQSAGLYSLKIWEQGQPEPESWDLVHQAQTGLLQGSLVLIAHYVDATFGNVTVTPLPSP